MGAICFNGQREEGCLHSLDSGVPLLCMKTKQKERGTREERETETMREGGREGQRKGEQKI